MYADFLDFTTTYISMVLGVTKYNTVKRTVDGTDFLIGMLTPHGIISFFNQGCIT